MAAVYPQAYLLNATRDRVLFVTSAAVVIYVNT
jgi:hypothetical protein